MLIRIQSWGKGPVEDLAFITIDKIPQLIKVGPNKIAFLTQALS